MCVVSSLVSVMEDYFKKFSSKNCCYDDIKSYLGLLNGEQAKEVGTLAPPLSTPSTNYLYRVFAAVD